MPKISVITATYNRSDVLGRAMKSLQSQTFGDYEHIVVDDCSTDDTETVVTEHADRRVRYVRLDQNRGPAAAWNRGLEVANGEYVSFLDSDDEYLPERLERTNDTLDDQPESVAGLAHSYHRVADSKLSVQSVPSGEILFDDLAANNVICGSSNTMYRSSTFDRVGTFAEDFPAEVDYDFQLRVLEEYSLVGIAEPLVRKHERSDSIQNDPVKKRRGVKRFLEKHGDRLSDKRTAQKYRVIAQCYLQTGNRIDAARYFEWSIDVCPDNLVADLEYDVGLDYLHAGFKRDGRRHLRRSVWSRPTRYKPYIVLLVSLVSGDIDKSLEKVRSLRDTLSY